MREGVKGGRGGKGKNPVRNVDGRGLAGAGERKKERGRPGFFDVVVVYVHLSIYHF